VLERKAARKSKEEAPPDPNEASDFLDARDMLEKQAKEALKTCKNLDKKYRATYKRVSNRLSTSPDDDLLPHPTASIDKALTETLQSLGAICIQVKTVKKTAFDALQSDFASKDVQALECKVSKQCDTLDKMQKKFSKEKRADDLHEHYECYKIAASLEAGWWEKSLARKLGELLKTNLGMLRTDSPPSVLVATPGKSFTGDMVSVWLANEANADLIKNMLAPRGGWPKAEDQELRERFFESFDKARVFVTAVERPVALPVTFADAGLEEAVNTFLKSTDLKSFLIVQKRGTYRAGPQYYPGAGLPHLLFASPEMVDAVNVLVLDVTSLSASGVVLDALDGYLMNGHACKMFDKGQTRSTLISVNPGSVVFIPVGCYAVLVPFTTSNKLGKTDGRHFVSVMVVPLMIKELLAGTQGVQPSVHLEHVKKGLLRKTGAVWDGFKAVVAELALA